ncbi:MAG: nitroreductase family deazaflavin-dependent oxidoreductase [Chloroflexota bacterium]
MVLARGLAELGVCDLETIGRVSGRAHVVEMWFAADPARQRLYVMSGGRDEADWVRNIRRNGRVRVRLGRRWFAGTAELIEGAADEPVARRLLAAKYQGWTEGRALSNWARGSLPVAIDLAD